VCASPKHTKEHRTTRDNTKKHRLLGTLKCLNSLRSAARLRVWVLSCIGMACATHRRVARYALVDGASSATCKGPRAQLTMQLAASARVPGPQARLAHVDMLLPTGTALRSRWLNLSCDARRALATGELHRVGGCNARVSDSLQASSGGEAREIESQLRGLCSKRHHRPNSCCPGSMRQVRQWSTRPPCSAPPRGPLGPSPQTPPCCPPSGP